MSTDPILPGSRWRHLRRDTVYTVACLSEREADREPLVTYRGDDGRTWTRPVSEWRERFECVDAEPTDSASRDRALALLTEIDQDLVLTVTALLSTMENLRRRLATDQMSLKYAIGLLRRAPGGTDDR